MLYCLRQDVAVVGEDVKVPVLVPNALPDDVRLRNTIWGASECMVYRGARSKASMSLSKKDRDITVQQASRPWHTEREACPGSPHLESGFGIIDEACQAAQGNEGARLTSLSLQVLCLFSRPHAWLG